jgi:hypothetical protein
MGAWDGGGEFGGGVAEERVPVGDEPGVGDPRGAAAFLPFGPPLR